MAIKRIQLMSVPVSDQDRAKQFYIDKLGFTLIFDGFFGKNMRWVQLRLPGDDPGIALVTWFAEMPAGSLKGGVLETDDIEQTANQLIARGVDLHDDGRIQEAPWGRWVTLDDPDGNTWIVQQNSEGPDS